MKRLIKKTLSQTWGDLHAHCISIEFHCFSFCSTQTQTNMRRDIRPIRGEFPHWGSFDNALSFSLSLLHTPSKVSPWHRVRLRWKAPSGLSSVNIYCCISFNFWKHEGEKFDLQSGKYLHVISQHAEVLSGDKKDQNVGEIEPLQTKSPFPRGFT